MSTATTGSGAAQIIENLAAEDALHAEDALKRRIVEVAPPILGIRPEDLPARLINALSRGSTSFDPSKATDALSRMPVGGLSDELSLDLVRRIKQEVEVERKETHRMRTQASSIRSLMRIYSDPYLYKTLEPEILEKYQSIIGDLMDRKLENYGDLAEWCHETAKLFRGITSELDGSKNSLRNKTQGRLSETTAGNYINIFLRYVEDNGRRIVEDFGKEVSPESKLRDVNRFHSKDSYYKIDSDSQQFLDDRIILMSQGPRSLQMTNDTAVVKRSISVQDLVPLTGDSLPPLVTVVIHHSGPNGFTANKTWTTLSGAADGLAKYFARMKKMIPKMEEIDLAQITVYEDMSPESRELSGKTLSAIEDDFSLFISQFNLG